MKKNWFRALQTCTGKCVKSEFFYEMVLQQLLFKSGEMVWNDPDINFLYETNVVGIVSKIHNLQ